ncbi:Hsp20/alpha crystallin family protein [Patescibacteria group bacterium]|nr:Hsp20/alpha crystallin family protein [Patescibacteria group bacterium]
MASFFEKLKKGMGVEIAEEEPEKTEEELSEKPPKESKLPTGQAKSSTRKKRIKKIEIETDLINTETEKTEAEEPKKSEPREPEEKIESKQETKKTSLAKIAQGKEDKSSSSPFAAARVKEEKKLESNRQGFTLQNLSAHEGHWAVDVNQTDAELVIQSTIAGVKTENLDISIEADTVLIRGNRNEPPEQGEKNYFYQECYWGPFSRQIILPEETDPSRAEAVMKEGILTIRIPKIEREKKRKITVKE